MNQFKTLLFFAITTSLVFMLSSCSKENLDVDAISVYTGDDYLERKNRIGTGGGNGAPSGEHYTLNIIGVPQDKTAEMTGNNGHRIFTKLDGRSKIYLNRAPQGEDFAVLDANGTDGRAEFQLPAPTDVSYTIWARPLGTPGGSAEMTTCGTTTDPDTGELIEICSMTSEIFIREKGGSKFADITNNLVTITAAIEDLNNDGVVDELDVETYDIFDDILEDYFWQYDNNGLKLLQLRFYYD